MFLKNLRANGGIRLRLLMGTPASAKANSEALSAPIDVFSATEVTANTDAVPIKARIASAQMVIIAAFFGV